MDWPADLRPAALQQPDGFSCGAATVLAARMLLDPGSRPADVEQEVVALHRRLTSTHSLRDRFQLPWPRVLGTPPWAVANALTAFTGERVATVHTRPRPTVGYEVLAEQARTRPVAVYLGSRWLPRHVVLAFAATADGAVRLFDPAHGRLHSVPRDRWVAHDVRVAGWTHSWFVV
jgi:hypothetical protein